MSRDPKQSFPGITRASFARLQQKATKAGIHVSSPIGEAVKDGVRIQWNYDAATELLEVTCKAPFWINSSRINKDLRHEIEAALGYNRAA